MLGSVTVKMDGLDLAALNQAMARHIAEPAPESMRMLLPEIALVQRALHWAAAVQRQFNVPVFQAGHTWIPSGSVKLRELRVAVPYSAPHAAQAALSWVGAAIASFMACGELAPLGLAVR